ncbi:hypothetical protein [Streptomyces collinus]|uniref:hypothetical protein n=1 Tax=Streptomyces collinus TaxID=42684 RepID=UPI0036A7F1EE
MTSPSNPVRWLLEVTAAAAPADPAAFDEQRQLLRSVAQFNPAQRTWRTHIGALDIRALDVLQRFYEAAGRFGTTVRLEAVAAPDSWSGPCFDEAGELAALVSARADHGRRLGQLPLS